MTAFRVARGSEPEATHGRKQVPASASGRCTTLRKLGPGTSGAEEGVPGPERKWRGGARAEGLCLRNPIRGISGGFVQSKDLAAVAPKFCFRGWPG